MALLLGLVLALDDQGVVQVLGRGHHQRRNRLGEVLQELDGWP